MVFTHRDKLILSAIIALFAVRLVTIHTIQLSPDEAYYWNWGQHPSLAYSDHPPMVAWLMAFFTALGGNSELFVRLGGFLLSAAALFFLFSTARSLLQAASSRRRTRPCYSSGLPPSGAGAASWRAGPGGGGTAGERSWAWAFSASTP